MTGDRLNINLGRRTQTEGRIELKKPKPGLRSHLSRADRRLISNSYRFLRTGTNVAGITPRNSTSKLFTLRKLTTRAIKSQTVVVIARFTDTTSPFLVIKLLLIWWSMFFLETIKNMGVPFPSQNIIKQSSTPFSSRFVVFYHRRR